MKEGAKGSQCGRQRLRKALVVIEIALAMLLLIGAGLLTQSFRRLQQADLGFNPDRLLTMRVALPWRKYNDAQGAERQREFFRQLLDRLAGLPGAASASMTSNLPLSAERQEGKLTFAVEGQSADERQRNPFANDLRVSPNYFQAMGIRLIAGRSLSETDTAATERVVVISQRLAERAFPGGNPIGQRLLLGALFSEAVRATIVGVVSNVKHDAIAGEDGLDLYSSYLQLGDSNMYLLIRTTVPPASLISAATQAVWAGDPEQSTYNIVTMEERIADTIWQRRLAGALFLFFAGLALALAAVGIYGVMAYMVGQRTREIGIRLSLGAEPRDVMRMIFRQGAALLGLGLAIGALAALLGGRLIESLLYGVRSADPAVYLAVSVPLALVALLACWLPARRATRIDPLQALRQE